MKRTSSGRRLHPEQPLQGVPRSQLGAIRAARTKWVCAAARSPVQFADVTECQQQIELLVMLG